MAYRIYIDEVGNHDMQSALKNPRERYLCLTGVIFDLQYVKDHLHPAVESLKRKYFNHHPDEPVILHRKELVNKRPPFCALSDPATEESFNCDLLDLLARFHSTVICVVIDKKTHHDRYVEPMHPYHYCLRALMERYVLWLNGKGAVGDAMAESRGGREDVELKSEFTRFYERGTAYVPASIIARRLTSKQLKLKRKSENVAGLQIADLIAHPVREWALARKKREPMPETFGRRVADVIERKFRRGRNGTIDGYGLVWLSPGA